MASIKFSGNAIVISLGDTTYRLPMDTVAYVQDEKLHTNANTPPIDVEAFVGSLAEGGGFQIPANSNEAAEYLLSHFTGDKRFTFRINTSIDSGNLLMPIYSETVCEATLTAVALREAPAVGGRITVCIDNIGLFEISSMTFGGDSAEAKTAIFPPNGVLKFPDGLAIGEGSGAVFTFSF